ncbi:hypothetical protein D3C81_731450 [compost metagenome]
MTSLLLELGFCLLDFFVLLFNLLNLFLQGMRLRNQLRIEMLQLFLLPLKLFLRTFESKGMLLQVLIGAPKLLLLALQFF